MKRREFLAIIGAAAVLPLLIQNAPSQPRIDREAVILELVFLYRDGSPEFREKMRDGMKDVSFSSKGRKFFDDLFETMGNEYIL